MGGYGSGWTRPKRTTVEECLVLPIATLVRKGALAPGARTRGTWGWWREGEARPIARIGYEADLRDPGDAWLRLHYSVDGEPVEYRVRLTTTRPTYGGLRWWFLCPLARRGGAPGRRAAKLYLPPGGRYFGSRAGHRLTYTSCQESGQFRVLFRRIAAELGTDEATVRSALKRRRS